MVAKPIDLDEALALALRLSPLDRVRLVERVMSTLEREFAPPTPPAAEFPLNTSPAYTEDELRELMNAPRLTPAELFGWLEANPTSEPWGDLRDDEDAGEYVHQMRRRGLDWGSEG